MRTIFWGLLFAWLHININIGNRTIELLPVLGWSVVWYGVHGLPPSRETGEIEWPLRILIALTAVSALSDAAFGGLPFVGGAIDLLGLLCMLYVTWTLVALVDAAGKRMSCPMPVDSLRACWKAMAVCAVCGWVLGLSVVFFGWAAVLAAGIALADLAAMIGFLVFFWKAVRSYETAQDNPVQVLPPEDGAE